MCSSAQLSPTGQQAHLPAPPGAFSPCTWASIFSMASGPGLLEPRHSHMLLLGPQGLVVWSCGLEQIDFLLLKGGRAGQGQPGLAWDWPPSLCSKRGLPLAAGACVPVCVHACMCMPVCA